MAGQHVLHLSAVHVLVAGSPRDAHRTESCAPVELGSGPAAAGAVASSLERRPPWFAAPLGDSAVAGVPRRSVPPDDVAP